MCRSTLDLNSWLCACVVQLVSTSKQGQWTTVASLSVFGSMFSILFGVVKRVLLYFVLKADEHHDAAAAAAASSSVQLHTIVQQQPQSLVQQQQQHAAQGAPVAWS